MQRLLIAAASTFGILILAQPTFAFDRHGYQSCMTINQAQSLANSRGEPMHLEPGIGSETYTIGDPGYSTVLTFKRVKLVGLSTPIAGGFDAFSSLLKDWINDLGQPEMTANSYYSQLGQVSSLYAKWKQYDGSHSTIAITKSQNQLGVSIVDFAGQNACN